ncbi:unnamed protein product, partial [Didymodactylos carnosus]
MQICPVFLFCARVVLSKSTVLDNRCLIDKYPPPYVVDLPLPPCGLQATKTYLPESGIAGGVAAGVDAARKARVCSQRDRIMFLSSYLPLPPCGLQATKTYLPESGIAGGVAAGVDAARKAR